MSPLNNERELAMKKIITVHCRKFIAKRTNIAPNGTNIYTLYVDKIDKDGMNICGECLSYDEAVDLAKWLFEHPDNLPENLYKNPRRFMDTKCPGSVVYF
jgi:hypothetical protein